MTAYVNTFQRLTRQEALAEGIEEGIQRGTHVGAERVFRSLLARRFGELPAWAAEKLAAASADTIESWSLRVLDARSVDEVFA